MSKKIRQLIFLFLIIFCFVFFKPATQAETSLTAEDVAQQQADLQDQLKDIESKITQYQKDLKGIQGQKNTLNNKISKLKKQADTISLQIEGTALEITYLKLHISRIQYDIEDNTAEGERLKGHLEQLLISMYKIDNSSPLYPFLAAQNFSEMFLEIKNHSKILSGLRDLVDEIKAINEQLAKDKQDLADKQDSTKNLLAIQGAQKQNLVDSAAEQKTILTQTKGKESNYQIMLADKKKQAKTIRERLYQLLDVEKQINFGQAVQIAQWASGNSGVRTAFLLAVLTQESNLGKNVGTCNRAKDPPSKSWKVVMHPTRDQPLFSKITEELGLNADITPISCPMRGSDGKQIGWGGAMGPAQFIPSTWMGYKNKVAAITGKSANPWDIRDAFLAAAIKLGHDGATSKEGEWAAAMKYFSGSTNVKFRFYGDNVIARAEKYQEDIDALNK